MSARYVASIVILVLCLTTMAIIWGRLLPGVEPLGLVAIALGAYTVALLLNVLPPGRPSSHRPAHVSGAEPSARRVDPPVGFIHGPASQANQRDRGPLTGRYASKAAIQIIAVVLGVTGIAVVLAIQQVGQADEPFPMGREDVAAPDSDIEATPSARPPSHDTEAELTKTPPPTPSPPAPEAPTRTPTPQPTPVPTPQRPVSPFAYCTHLYADNYSCGDQPWRVICTPDGYFFDPEGVIPKPIPQEWPGWYETTLTQRLEYIHDACE